MLEQPEIQPIEFEVRETLGDVLRMYASLVGPGLPLFSLMGVGLVMRGVVNIVGGRAPDVGAVFALVCMGIFAWSISRRLQEQHRYRYRVTSDHLIVMQSTGQARLSWTSITKIEESFGILSLTGNARIGLPWYRMSAEQREVIGGQLGQHAPSKETSGGHSVRGAIVIVVVLVVFLTLYNTFGGR